MLTQDLETKTTAIAQPQLYGLSATHLVDFEANVKGSINDYRESLLLEPRTLKAFLSLKQAALIAGFDLCICSAYRNFDRQLAIWNAKARGQRALLDNNSQPIVHENLSPDELIDAILLWSALPGASRHHWGTDLDVYDANKITKAELQLVSHEYQLGGPCYALAQWLSLHGPEYGFYFPYQAGLSGVSPEPWHISYFPVAACYLADYDSHDLIQLIAQSDISPKAALLARLSDIVDSHVRFVAPLPVLDPKP
ncbi:M15 family metallopeptidase [Shewanella sp. SR44-3]|uniref:M15 family metallopeptidase n=1 Tax=Shewanella sp. SR44-3 TaxID=2760936 RepID=UPI0028735BBF|nr:M15 family metallopeptidase [Shewanella sp. SR44-3]